MPARATKSNLSKAYIQVVQGAGGQIPVLFNPTEYSLDKSNEFANINIPGLESPLLQFVRGGLQTLSMDLFFDTWEEKKDVRTYTDRVVKLLKIDASLHAPPILKFLWGSLSFICVLSKVTQKFTMFGTDGKPVRATLSVTFNEYKTGNSGVEVHLESWDRTKHYVTRQGDTLWQIAWEEYGATVHWRAIAKANKITDPRSIKAGLSLVIPAIR